MRNATDGSSMALLSSSCSNLLNRRFMFLSPDGLAALLHQLRDEPSPSGVVVGADARARIPIEVFIKQHEVAPVRVGLQFFGIAVYRPAPFFVSKKNAGHAARQLSRHLPQRQHFS